MGVAFNDVDNFTAAEAFIATWENVVPYTEGTISVSYLAIRGGKLVLCKHKLVGSSLS